MEVGQTGWYRVVGSRGDRVRMVISVSGAGDANESFKLGSGSYSSMLIPGLLLRAQHGVDKACMRNDVSNAITAHQ